MSLLNDLTCPSDVIPSRCIATLTKHTDQVWFVMFSNIKGELLATVCKDGTIAIWRIQWIDRNGLYRVLIKFKRLLKTKLEIISSVSWTNTTDNFIISAGKSTNH